jgi:hypothetical protein
MLVRFIGKKTSLQAEHVWPIGIGLEVAHMGLEKSLVRELPSCKLPPPEPDWSRWLSSGSLRL